MHAARAQELLSRVLPVSHILHTAGVMEAPLEPEYAREARRLPMGPGHRCGYGERYRSGTAVHQGGWR